ncbi:hypothetical protein AB4Z09_08335 [Rhodococcus sp. TAF43]|uniref:hypothetical protein n=1 Tax=unclassified Rhodococcus (in: high G+C Gram-positive bacteria) TaxID=192944 RepID=UPI003D208250
MNVRNKAALAGVLAGAAAMTALGAGVAQAGTPQRPTADYQMCGNVTSGGAGVGGVSVTGNLSTGGTYTATTASDGGYCLQGNAAMKSAVLGGAKVVLSGTNGTSAVNFGTWGTSGIGTGDFFTHVDSVYFNSAYGFNGTL